MKAIIGAVLMDGLGGPPLSGSVVVVAGGHIREAGDRSTVAIPASEGFRLRRRGTQPKEMKLDKARAPPPPSPCRHFLIC